MTALLELSDVRLPYCWEPGVDWNEVAKETLRHQDWDVLLGKFWEKKRAEASGKALSETAADSEGLEDFGDSEESCRLWGWFQSRKSRSRRMAKQMTKEFFWVEGFPLTLERQIDRRQVERIGQAMQCWRLEHDGKLPPAFTTDSEGRPLHSWRVLLLPYLGEAELFAKIRLNEPWDSEWNSQFHAQIVKAFQPLELSLPGNPLSPAEKHSFAGKTRCCVLLGEKTFFNASGRGVDYWQLIRDVPDCDFGRMALVTLRQEPICWMKPDAEPEIASFLRELQALELRSPGQTLCAAFCFGNADWSVVSEMPQIFEQMEPLSE